MRYLLSFIFLLLYASPVISATGDLLYSNCAGGNCCASPIDCGQTGSNTGWIRTVETNGCRSGNCLKLVGLYKTGDGSAYGNGNTAMFTSAVAGKREITVSTWVKYNKLASSIAGGNIKLSRPYTGGETFWGSDIIPNVLSGGGNYGGYYISTMLGTFTKAPWFNLRLDTSTSPNDNGDGTYTSTDGWIMGNIVSGGPTPPGATWQKVTKYLKLPSTSTAADGVMKLWIGDELMLHVYNSKFKYAGNASTFSEISFYPSSEAEEPFEHWMDEMVIYEGYVPPGPQIAVDGACNNTYNGGTFTSLTASDPICTTGAVGSFSPGPPTATWQCLGLFDGAADNCSATITPETCAENYYVCPDLTSCLDSWPSNSYCNNDDPKCHPGDCLAVGSATNFNLLDPTDCAGLDFFYWDGVCNTVAQPDNLISGNLLTNSNVSLNWPDGQTLPTGYTSYIPGNVEKTFLGARMFNNATLNPAYLLDVDTTYTVVYNLPIVTGHGKIWAFGFPQDFLSSAPGTIVHQFTTPSVMSDRKIYIGSSDGSTVEENNFRLYKSSKDTPVIPPGAPSQRYRIGDSIVTEVTNN